MVKQFQIQMKSYQMRLISLCDGWQELALLWLGTAAHMMQISLGDGGQELALLWLGTAAHTMLILLLGEAEK